MGVVCRVQLPKDRPCHVVVEEFQPGTRLWRLDRLEVVRKWKDLEKFVRWIGSIGGPFFGPQNVRKSRRAKMGVPSSCYDV